MANYGFKELQEVNSTSGNKQPGNISAVPVSEINVQDLRQKYQGSIPDMSKVQQQIYGYVATASENPNINNSFANFAEEIKGESTGMLSLVAAREKPMLIGMSTKQVDDEPVTAVKRTVMRNLADTSLQMFAEKYNETGDVVEASLTARQFIDSSLNDLGSYNPNDKYNQRFKLAFHSTNYEDITNGKSGVKVGDKLYETSMFKGISSGINDKFWNNFLKSTGSQLLATEGFTGYVYGLFSDAPELFRDQQKNPLVTEQLKGTAGDIGLEAGTALGTGLGIGAIVYETAITGGILGVAKAGQVARLATQAGLQVARGASQDSMDNDALSRKYILGNEWQKPHMRAMLQSRTFDVVTGALSGAVGDAITGSLQGKILSGISKDAIVGQKQLMNFGVYRGIMAGGIDIGTDVASDLGFHNVLANKAGLEFTESQMLTLDVSSLKDNPSMLARYVLTKVAGRGIGGAVGKWQSKKAASGTEREGREWYEDPAQKSALNFFQKSIKFIGDKINNDLYTDIDRKVREATAQSGGTPIGLRNILTDKNLSERFQKWGGEHWIAQEYVAHSLANNLLFSSLSKDGLAVDPNFIIELKNRHPLSVIDNIIDRKRSTSALDLTMKKDKAGNVVRLSEQETLGAMSDIVGQFINSKSTSDTIEGDVKDLLSFVLAGNISMPKTEAGANVGLRSVLDAVVDRAILKNVGTPEAVKLAKSTWSNGLKVSYEEGESLDDVRTRLQAPGSTDDYNRKEFATREIVAKKYGLENTTKQYLDQLYGDLPKLNQEWERVRGNLDGNGSIKNLWSRISYNYNEKNTESLNRTIEDISKTFNSLSKSDGIDEQARDYADIERVMTQSAKSLLDQYKSRLQSIAMSNASPDAKVQNFMIEMSNIKNVGNIFGIKVQKEMYDMFYGDNRLSEETLKVINDTFAKATTMNKDTFNLLLGAYATDKAVKDVDGSVNVWASFFNDINTTTQRQFFNAQILSSLFDDSSSIKFLNKLITNDYVRSVSGRNIDGSVLNALSSASVKGIALPLYAGDNKAYLYNEFVQNSFPGTSTKEYTNEEYSTIASVIVAKAAGKYLRETDSPSVAGARQAIEKAFTDMDGKLLIKPSDINDGSLKSIVDEFNNPNGNDVSRSWYSILDSQAINSLASKYESKSKLHSDLFIAADVMSVKNEVTTDKFNIDLTNVDPDAIYHWKVGDKEKSGYIDDYIAAIETGLNDGGYSVFISINSIINAAPDATKARAAIVKYIDDITKLAGVEQLDVARTIDKPVSGLSDKKLFADTLLSRVLNQRYTSININPLVDSVNNRVVFSSSAVPDVSNVVFNRGNMIMTSTEQEDYSRIDQLSTRELNNYGLFKIAQSGTASKAVLMLIPGYSYDNAVNAISRSGIIQVLDEAFQTIGANNKAVLSDATRILFNNIRSAKTEADVVLATNIALKAYRDEITEKLKVGEKRYEAFAKSKPKDNKMPGAEALDFSMYKDLTDKLGGLINGIVRSDGTIDGTLLGIELIVPTARVDLASVNEMIQNKIANADTSTLQGLTQLISDIKSTGVSIRSDIQDVFDSVNEQRGLRTGASLAESAQSKYADALIFQDDAIGYAFYDKLHSQLKVLASAKDITINNGLDAFTMLAKIAYAGESAVTAKDLQKRASVFGTGIAGAPSKALQDLYSQRIKDTGKVPKVYIIRGEDPTAAGAVGFPGWFIEAVKKMSIGDGSKLTITDLGDLQKIEAIETSLMKLTVSKSDDIKLTDQDGNVIKLSDINDDDIILNTEAWKQIGSSMIDLLPEVKQSVTVDGIQRTFKHNIMSIDNEPFVKRLLTERVHIHSELKGVAGKGNLSDQTSVTDPEIGKLLSLYALEMSDKVIPELRKQQLSQMIISDPSKAMKELQSVLRKGVKVNRYTSIASPFIRHDSSNSTELSTSLQRRVAGKDIMQPSVGVGMGWLVDQIVASPGYKDEGNVIVKRILANKTGVPDAVVKQGMEYLSKQKDAVVGKIGDNYFIMAVRFPAQNFGQVGIFQVTHIRKSVYHNRLESDPSYQPVIQKTDFDGDTFQGLPFSMDKIKKAFNLDPTDISDEQLLNVFAERTAKAYAKVSQVKDVVIIAPQDKREQLLDAMFTGINLGGFVKSTADYMLYSQQDVKGIGKQIEAQFSKYFVEESGNLVFDANKVKGADDPMFIPIPKMQDTDNLWSFITKGNDQTFSGAGSVAGWKVLGSDFKVGQKNYRILTAISGRERAVTTLPDGTVGYDNGKTMVQHLILEGDYAEDKYATGDFGDNVVGVITEKTVDRSIHDSLLHFDSDEMQYLGKGITESIKGKLALLQSGSNRPTDVHQMLKSLTESNHMFYKNIEQQKLRITNNQTMFAMVNNTGTDAAKGQGLAYLADKYGTDNLIGIVESITRANHASMSVIVNTINDDYMTVGNFITPAKASTMMSKLNSKSVVGVSEAAIRERSDIAFEDYKAIKKMLGKDFLEAQDLNDILMVVARNNFDMTTTELAERYGFEFALAYDLAKHINNQRLGIFPRIGLSPEHLGKTYLGSVDDNVTKLYFDGTYKTVPTKTMNTKGELLTGSPLLTHAYANEILNKVLASDRLIEGLGDVGQLEIKIKMMGSPAYLTDISGVGANSETIAKNLVETIYDRMKTLHPESVTSRQQIENALTELGMLAAGKIKLEAGQVPRNHAIKDALRLASAEFKTVVDHMSSNRQLKDALESKSMEDPIPIIQIKNNKGQQITATQLIGNMNNVLTNIPKDKSYDTKVYGDVYSTLIGMSTPAVAQTAYMRKVGFSEQFESIIKGGIDKMKASDKVGTDYDMDIDLMDVVNNSRYTAYAVSMDYFPIGLKRAVTEKLNNNCD